MLSDQIVFRDISNPNKSATIELDFFLIQQIKNCLISLDFYPDENSDFVLSHCVYNILFEDKFHGFLFSGNDYELLFDSNFGSKMALLFVLDFYLEEKIRSSSPFIYCCPDSCSFDSIMFSAQYIGANFNLIKKNG